MGPALRALGLCLGLFLGVLPAGAASAESVDDALRRTIAARKIQTEIPAPAPVPAPGWLQKFLNRLPAIGPMSPEAARIMLYISLAVIALVLAWSLRGRRWGGRRELEDAPVENPAAALVRLGQAQASAEELAGRGLFAQALHVLLLQGVEEMRRRLASAPIAPALTSREILARSSLAPAAGAALADLIARVEISHFGPHAPGAEEYAAGRLSFETLTAWLRSGGTAS